MDRKMLQTKQMPSSNGVVQIRGTDDGCCGIFFLKYVLYIFNFILLLSGFAILAVGLLTFFVSYLYTSLLGGHLYAFVISTYVMIGTGGLIILFVFVIGCCATCQKSRICLMTYSVFLMLVFLLEAGVGIVAYMYEIMYRANGEFSKQLFSAMMYKYQESPSTQVAIDHLQTTFRCCGGNSFGDWMESEWHSSALNTYNGSVPDSCCKTITSQCGINVHPSNINTEGCFPVFEGLVQEQLIIIGGVGLGLCCLQIFGIVFACCLAKKVRKWRSRENGYWE